MGIHQEAWRPEALWAGEDQESDRDRGRRGCAAAATEIGARAPRLAFAPAPAFDARAREEACEANALVDSVQHTRARGKRSKSVCAKCWNSSIQEPVSNGARFYLKK